MTDHDEQTSFDDYLNSLTPEEKRGVEIASIVLEIEARRDNAVRKDPDAPYGGDYGQDEIEALVAQAAREGKESLRKRLAELMNYQDKKNMDYEARYVGIDMVIRAPDRKLTQQDKDTLTQAQLDSEHGGK